MQHSYNLYCEHNCKVVASFQFTCMLKRKSRTGNESKKSKFSDSKWYYTGYFGSPVDRRVSCMCACSSTSHLAFSTNGLPPAPSVQSAAKLLLSRRAPPHHFHPPPPLLIGPAAVSRFQLPPKRPLLSKAASCTSTEATGFECSTYTVFTHLFTFGSCPAHCT